MRRESDRKMHVKRPVRRSGRKRARAALTFTAVLVAATLILAMLPAISDLFAGSGSSNYDPSQVTSGTAAGSRKESTAPADSSETTETSETTAPVFEEKEIQLVGVGDVLLHMPVIEGVRASVDGQTIYQFEPVFKYIKPIVNDAEYAVFNFEGTLGGEPYSGYPLFSAPDDILPALKNTGFDLGNTANNHTIDRGMKGLFRTVDAFGEYSLPNIGTRSDENAKSYRVERINDINIGFSSFTFETIGTETSRALNGITMPAEAEPLIDSFNPYRDNVFEQDMLTIIERVDEMRSEGAEFICMVMHWGEEYHTKSSNYQQTMAQRLADAGVDLIIGHHPHVIQEISFVKSADGSHEMLVYYSLGNFISNQYFNTGNAAGKGQDGLMARITIRKTQEKTGIVYAEYIPTHVVRVTANGRESHRVVPVLDALENPQAFETTSDLMQTSLDRTAAIMSNNGSSGQIELSAAGISSKADRLPED